MLTMTEQKNLGDLLKYEAPNLYSREAVTIAAGQSVLPEYDSLVPCVIVLENDDGGVRRIRWSTAVGTIPASGEPQPVRAALKRIRIANDVDALVLDRRFECY